MALGQRTGRKRQVVAWRDLAPAVTSAVQPESFQQRGFQDLSGYCAMSS